jgi:hypothetical protein
MSTDYCDLTTSLPGCSDIWVLYLNYAFECKQALSAYTVSSQLSGIQASRILIHPTKISKKNLPLYKVI